jgi:hypothetical protein
VLNKALDLGIVLLRRATRNCDCDRDLADEAPCLVADVATNSAGADPFNGGFKIFIDGLSLWLMRIAREIGHGAAL